MEEKKKLFTSSSNSKNKFVKPKSISTIQEIAKNHKISNSKSTKNFNSKPKNKLASSQSVKYSSENNSMKKGMRVRSALNVVENKNKPMLKINSSRRMMTKVDPEFYHDNADVLWEKEIQRVKTESIILYRPCSQKFSKERVSNFGGVS